MPALYSSITSELAAAVAVHVRSLVPAPERAVPVAGDVMRTLGRIGAMAALGLGEGAGDGEGLGPDDGPVLDEGLELGGDGTVAWEATDATLDAVGPLPLEQAASRASAGAIASQIGRLVRWRTRRFSRSFGTGTTSIVDVPSEDG